MGYGLAVIVIVIVIVKSIRLNYCPKDERMRDSACA